MDEDEAEETTHMAYEAWIGVRLLEHDRVVHRMVVVDGVLQCSAEAFVRAGNLRSGEVDQSKTLRSRRHQPLIDVPQAAARTPYNPTRSPTD